MKAGTLTKAAETLCVAPIVLTAVLLTLVGCAGEVGPPGEPGSDGAAPECFAVPAFGPESLYAGTDGTLYVSSVTEGSIFTISPDRKTISALVGPESAQPLGKNGVFVDETAGDLWTCSIGTDFVTPSELRRYDLADGSLLDTFPMAPGHESGFCNDLANDAAGNLYITDSFIGIQRLPAGGDALEHWSTDPLYAPPAEGAFAIDGIVIDGDNVYVNNLSTGALIRVPIEAGGAAGTPVQIAGVTLSAPDGMRLLGPNTILVAEAGAAFGGADALSKVVVAPAADTGTRVVLSNRLDRPSAVAITQGDAWVAEGQIARVFGIDADGQLPFVPFQICRVELFQ